MQMSVRAERGRQLLRWPSWRRQSRAVASARPRHTYPLHWLHSCCPSPRYPARCRPIIVAGSGAGAPVRQVREMYEACTLYSFFTFLTLALAQQADEREEALRCKGEREDEDERGALVLATEVAASQLAAQEPVESQEPPFFTAMETVQKEALVRRLLAADGKRLSRLQPTEASALRLEVQQQFGLMPEELVQLERWPGLKTFGLSLGLYSCAWAIVGTGSMVAAVSAFSLNPTFGTGWVGVRAWRVLAWARVLSRIRPCQSAWRG